MKNNIDDKILPFKINEIHSYPLYATIFGILGQYKHAINWCYLKFFMIFSYCNDSNFYLDYSTEISDSSSWPKFENCPYLNSKKISRKQIDEKYNSISEFIIEAVNHGYYSYFFLDTYYIKEYKVNVDRPLDLRKHECLIYGYHLQKLFFYYADYFGGFYQLKEIPFEEVEKAYYSFKNDSSYYLYDYVYLLSVSEDIKKIGLKADLDFCISAIDQYLAMDKNGVKLPVKGDIYWGVQTYDLFQNNISQLLDGQNNFDIRNYYVLNEHKFIMTRFIDIICTYWNVSFLDNQVLKVYEISTIIRNLMLKYTLTKDKEILYKVKEKLDEMYMIENKYLNEMRDILKSMLIKN